MKTIRSEILANFPLSTLDERRLVRTLPSEYMNPDTAFRVVDAEAECTVCGFAVIEHPQCGRILNADNSPFLYIFCTQERVVVR